jgi:hypothetical protein
MSAPIARIGNAERDEEGREFLQSESWQKMVGKPGMFSIRT